MNELTQIQNTIRVIIEKGDCEKKEFLFNEPFIIGREKDCEIYLKDGIVSRKHVEIANIDGDWVITDCNSRNGTFINNKKIERVLLESAKVIELGKDGPIISLSKRDEIAANVNNNHQPSVTKYIKHYFDDDGSDDEIGEHTMMIRQAFNVVHKKQSSKYLKIILGLCVIALIISAYAVYQNIKTLEQKELAENIFFEMKTMELEISKLAEAVEESGSKDAIKAVRNLRTKYMGMEEKYDQYISELDIYDLGEEEQIIYRIARLFGECEINIPENFIDEVETYIRKWQSTGRLRKAIARASENNYNEVIIDNMLSKHLPPQFFYLGLQESDFIYSRVGPKTRYGIAKGIWQFIPSTGIRYGLKMGPLVELERYDPRDERFDFEKATIAASKYLSDIYNTEAQASGLLVIASYNWGEGNIRNLIKKLPGNPKERNFWKLLEKYKEKIPTETYNYVFYIFSAAVIGENPKLFGFNFKNPLDEVT